MKKILIAALLLLSISIQNSVFGQTAQASKYGYCELVGTQKLLSTKITITIDYGQDKGGVFSAIDSRVKDEQSGKVKAFNSMVDALNSMGVDGWEFVQAYITGDASMGYVYHWLLKKKMN